MDGIKNSPRNEDLEPFTTQKTQFHPGQESCGTYAIKYLGQANSKYGKTIIN